VPVYANARPASNMSATVDSITLNSTPGVTSTLVLSGTGVNTGSSYPHDVISLVSALELQYRSPNEASSSAIDDKADLAYVGIASDVAATTTFTETYLYFGLATYSDWSTPNEVEFDVYIDTDRDGADDYVLFNSNNGLQSGGDQNDILLTFLYDLKTSDLTIEDYLNGTSPGDYDTAVFNNNVLVLPVAAADLGLTAASARFNYRVVSLSLDSPGNEPGIGGAITGIVDQTGTLSYNAAQPGVDTSGGVPGAPFYDDLPGEEIPLLYNRDAFFTSRSRGILLLHHHNQRGARAEVIDTGASYVFLPTMRK